MSYRVTADNGVPREYLFYAQRFINADTRAEAEQAIQTLIAEGWKNIERDYPEEEEQMTERGVEYVVEFSYKGTTRATPMRNTWKTQEEAIKNAQELRADGNYQNVTIFVRTPFIEDDLQRAVADDIAAKVRKATVEDVARDYEGFLLQVHTLYDIAKAVPHPYDALSDYAKKLLHDGTAWGFKLKKILEKS